MAKWYKQSSSEYLNADFRNAFSNSNNNNSNDKKKEDSKVSDEDTDFILANGMLSILKQKIAENLDLNRAVVEKGRYLTTVKMDRSMFEEVFKCKDWKLINRILGKLNLAGSNISFYERGNIIEIDIPQILNELDNYTSRKLKEKIENGQLDVSLLKEDKFEMDTHSTDTRGLDMNTSESIDNTESDTHTDSDINNKTKDIKQEHKNSVSKHLQEFLDSKK